MIPPTNVSEQISEEGFAIAENIFTDGEIEAMLSAIAQADHSNPNFRKTNDLFAIRQFFQQVPDVVELVFNVRLKQLIRNLFAEEYFVVKSIYFDKPEQSNWFVSYHQDLTISVDTRIESEGYGPWTIKQNQFAVQPPLEILQDNFTIRIHLDYTHQDNGALRIVPKSHLKGIYRPETIDWEVETEVICDAPKGALMLMKPLLLHSSGRTTNKEKRRVIHIEFSRTKLPEGLRWSEFLDYGIISKR